MSSPLQPFVVSKTEGRLAAGAETNGSLTVSIGTMSPGGWIEPHIHNAEEEAWYVLDGTLTFRFGGKEHDAPTGSFVLVPRGNAHCFGNNTNEPARFLMLFTPAGMEGFFEKMDRLAAEVGGYTNVRRDKMIAIAREHHMEHVPDA